MTKSYRGDFMTLAEFEEFLQLASEAIRYESFTEPGTIVLQFANEHEAERFHFLLQRLASVVFLQ
jgi:hypothetical protein